MDEMLKKQDVLDSIYATMDKTDKPDVVLGLAAAMSTVKKMQAAPVMPAEKQEPCTDAISRQAAIYVINHAEVNFSVESEIDFTKHKREVHEIIENVLGAQEKALKELQPVTPAKKVGHWILLDKCSNSGYYCSECRKKVVKEGWSNTVKKIKFCPHCGSKMMQEVEE